MPTFFLNYWKPLFIGFLAITFGIGCLELARQAEINTERLVELQAWVRGVR